MKRKEETEKEGSRMFFEIKNIIRKERRKGRRKILEGSGMISTNQK